MPVYSKDELSELRQAYCLLQPGSPVRWATCCPREVGCRLDSRLRGNDNFEAAEYVGLRYEARRIGTVWSSGFALLSPTYELRGNDNSEAVE